MNRRNVAILSICQALGFSGTSMVVLVGGLVGEGLAQNKSLATLPISAMVMGTALFTMPAALVMQRIGRRLGFTLSAVTALLAALGAAYAIAKGSFALFCLAVVFIGGNLASVQQYRFAAAESVDTAHVGKAVSFVLLGGVVAGYLGPQVGAIAKDWLPYGAYAGSFVGLAVLYAIAIVLLICVAFAVFGGGFVQYWGALVFLGIGWNFLFTGATVLLTHTYRAKERFKAQGINDLAVFGILALATLSAGVMIMRASWPTLNLVMLPFVLLTLALVLFIRPSVTTPGDAVG